MAYVRSYRSSMGASWEGGWRSSFATPSTVEQISPDNQYVPDTLTTDVSTATPAAVTAIATAVPATPAAAPAAPATVKPPMSTGAKAAVAGGILGGLWLLFGKG